MSVRIGLELQTRTKTGGKLLFVKETKQLGNVGSYSTRADTFMADKTSAYEVRIPFRSRVQPVLKRA